MFIKRIVAATFVTALTLVGVAPAATATKGDSDTVKIVKVKPTKSTGGATTNRIDWD